jgi:hypothetical protein
MDVSTRQRRKFAPASEIVMAVAFASVVGAMSLSPAFGQYDRNNDNRYRGAQDRNQNDNRYRYDNRGRNDRRDQRSYRPAYQHPYRYSQPVYAPPTAYYYPEQRPGISLQSPGINLFFPLDVR